MYFKLLFFVVLVALVSTHSGHMKKKIDETCRGKANEVECKKAAELCSNKTSSDRETRKQFWEKKKALLSKCLQEHGQEPISNRLDDEQDRPQRTLTPPVPKDRRRREAGHKDRAHEGSHKGHTWKRIEDIQDKAVAAKVRCCFGKRSNMVDDDGNIDEVGFITLMEKKFMQNHVALDAYKAAIGTTCSTTLRDCDIKPFKSCLFDACISTVQSSSTK